MNELRWEEEEQYCSAILSFIKNSPGHVSLETDNDTSKSEKILLVLMVAIQAHTPLLMQPWPLGPQYDLMVQDPITGKYKFDMQRVLLARKNLHYCLDLFKVLISNIEFFNLIEKENLKPFVLVLKSFLGAASSDENANARPHVLLVNLLLSNSQLTDEIAETLPVAENNTFEDSVFSLYVHLAQIFHEGKSRAAILVDILTAIENNLDRCLTTYHYNFHQLAFYVKLIFEEFILKSERDFNIFFRFIPPAERLEEKHNLCQTFCTLLEIIPAQSVQPQSNNIPLVAFQWLSQLFGNASFVAVDSLIYPLLNIHSKPDQRRAHNTKLTLLLVTLSTAIVSFKIFPDNQKHLLYLAILRVVKVVAQEKIVNKDSNDEVQAALGITDLSENLVKGSVLGKLRLELPSRPEALASMAPVA